MAFTFSLCFFILLLCSVSQSANHRVPVTECMIFLYTPNCSRYVRFGHRVVLPLGGTLISHLGRLPHIQAAVPSYSSLLEQSVNHSSSSGGIEHRTPIRNPILIAMGNYLECIPKGVPYIVRKHVQHPVLWRLSDFTVSKGSIPIPLISAL